MKFLKNMMQPEITPHDPGMSRRSFLKVTGGATAGLVVGFSLPVTGATAAEGDGTFNPFVRIAPDGTVTVLNKHLDMGQGNMTGLLSLVAEELDAAWDQMHGEFAPSDPKKYANLNWGVQGTGGSSAIPNSFIQYREAGASAKAMLIAAAAKSWKVKASEITVSDGVIGHKSGKKAGFGDFAALASAETPPEKPQLKSPDQFKFIGKTGYGRVDTKPKSIGGATYTQDIDRPGMLIAVVQRPSKFGATVKSVDDKAAREMKGVKDVVRIPQGVAVLADNTWNAMQARSALEITWDETNAETRSTKEIAAHYRELSENPGTVAVEGATDAAFKNAKTMVEATYEFPYLAHAPMEPMNAVVDLKPGQSLDVWTGSQLQTLDHNIASKIAELPIEKVKIHTLYAGGSFGRRANPTSDFINEAVHIAKAIGGRHPVKLVWSREDDIKGGYYRPLYVHKVRAGLNDAGEIVAWHHRIVGQSIVKGTPFEGGLVKNGIDYTSVEGASHLPYDVGAHQLELHTTDVGVPVLWWRSVGSTHTAYAVETMMDRLAKASGQDPVAFRLKHMKSNPRETGVLKLAAEKAGWGAKKLADGVHRGVAVHKSFGTYVAQIADVHVRDDGTVKVERVTCAVDLGVAVNPDQIAAQMEGGIGYGLGAVLRNRIDIKNGEVQQSQFYDYEPLRMSDMPFVETHIVPSAEAPTGAGEPGTPPIGPAVANAILWGTGKTIDALPFSKHGLT